MFSIYRIILKERMKKREENRKERDKRHKKNEKDKRKKIERKEDRKEKKIEKKKEEKQRVNYFFLNYDPYFCKLDFYLIYS